MDDGLQDSGVEKVIEGSTKKPEAKEQPDLKSTFSEYFATDPRSRREIIQGNLTRLHFDMEIADGKS